MTEINLKDYFVDLHVHIGRNKDNLPVKVTASKELTFANIALECEARKGIDIVGIVDCGSPRVIADIKELLNSGDMKELQDGGLFFHNKVTIILGSEIETKEKNGKLSHQIAYFPYLDDIIKFSEVISEMIRNSNLSSQNSRITAQEFFDIVNDLGGIIIPAHVFTPYKSVYGNCAQHLEEVYNRSTLKKIPAIELGLSADTYLADCIKELSDYTFVSNSDAHSLSKIGREYNIFQMKNPSYKELLLALKRESGRKVVANYGLNPKLGKYYRTFCKKCNYTAVDNFPEYCCKICGNKKITKGVIDRIFELSDNQSSTSPNHRPPYYHQVALDFIPGIGKKIKEKLFNHFGTEMTILHKANFSELQQVAGFKIAEAIITARKGKLSLISGGGGKYGKVKELV